MDTESEKREIRERGLVLAVVAMSVVCAAMGMALIDHPLCIFRARYLYSVDYSSEMHLLEAGRMFWNAGHSFYGYNPWFMAGYPHADYTSGVVWKVLGIILFFLKPAGVGAVLLAGALALFPITGYLSARSTGCGQFERFIIPLLFSLLAVTGHVMYLAWMGLLEAVLSTSMFLLSAVFLFRWMEEGKFSMWLGLSLSMALTIFSHKTAAVALGFAGLGVLFYRPAPARYGLAVLAGAAGVVCNFFWLLPLFRFRNNLDFVPHSFWGEEQKFLLAGDFFRLHSNLGSLILAWLLVVGSMAGWRRLRRENGRRWDAILATQAIIFLFSYIGPFIESLNPIQPRRFVNFALALAVIPTGRWLAGILAYRKPALVFTSMVLAMAAIFILPNAYTRVLPFRIISRLPVRSEAVVKWIKENTSREARVMVEEIDDAGNPKNPYGGFYLNNLLPNLTGREIVGGPYPGLDILQHRVTLLEGTLIGKPIGEYSDDELRYAMALYNIGWIVCFDERTKLRLEHSPGIFELSETFGPIECYIVKIPRSFIIGGIGEVKAGASVIDVRLDEIRGDRIILKYHWDNGLRAPEGVRIGKADIAPDPVGFIAVYPEKMKRFAITFD